MSKKEEDDLRSAAHQHWLKYQELKRRADDVAFKDRLEQIGWKVGDDLERVWKGNVQKVRIEGRDSGTGIMASKYKLDGELSVVTIRIYNHEGWKVVQK